MSNIVIYFEYTSCDNMVYEHTYFDHSIDYSPGIHDTIIILESDKDRYLMGQIKLMYNFEDSDELPLLEYGSSRELYKLLLEYIIENDHKNKFDPRIFKAMSMVVVKGTSEIDW